MSPTRYLRQIASRLPLTKALLWAVAIALLWGVDTLTKLQERARTGVGLDDFRLFTEQATSAAAALAMVMFVAWWLDRYPFSRSRPLRIAAAHVLGSVLFSFGHYALMVALRVVAFHAHGLHYVWAHSHVDNLIYEYQKDLKIYLGMVGVIAAYRYWQQQRRVVPATPQPAPSAGKIRVQTGSGERLIDVSAIEYLQAARNYVSVHAGGREYILRETLTNLESRLVPGGFRRTHRSFIVNVRHIGEMRPTGAGAWEILMPSGAVVPLSRGYRDAVRDELGRGTQHLQ